MFIVLCSVLLASCEDVIDVDLKDTEPQLVIAASMSPFDAEVIISETVPFSADQPFRPVSGAEVLLFDTDAGWYVQLDEVAPGEYRPEPYRLGSVVDVEKFLDTEFMVNVTIDSTYYVARAQAPRPVPIDSVGTSVTHVFDEDRKFAMVKFQDPEGEPNYYQYFQSVNGEPFKMLYVTDDKFNDGKYVSEALTDRDLILESGDSVDIRVRSIDKATFDFWEAVQAANPGSAAPANPPSVFYGALGYFSVYTEARVSTVIN